MKSNTLDISTVVNYCCYYKAQHTHLGQYRVAISKKVLKVYKTKLLCGPVISKSVFRHRKVPFYPTNINNVSFYGKFIDIDIDAQYQKMYTDVLIFPVFCSTIFEVT